MKFSDLSDRNQLALAELAKSLPDGEHLVYVKYGQAYNLEHSRPPRPFYEVKFIKNDLKISAKVREVVNPQVTTLQS